MVSDMGKLEAHRTYHRRCDMLLKCVTKVKVTLTGEEQPGLLDPSRDCVRPLAGLKALGKTIYS